MLGGDDCETLAVHFGGLPQRPYASMLPCFRGRLPIKSPGAFQASLAVSRRVKQSEEDFSARALVVVELNGGNDGLDSVVPFRNEAYYKARPTISVKPRQVLRADDEYGFHPCLSGFKRLYDSGLLAVVHGCGYSDASHSHFKSMEVWHTASPEGRKRIGWLGRLAQTAWPHLGPTTLVNIAEEQSLALRASSNSALVFKNGEDLLSEEDLRNGETFTKIMKSCDSGNEALAFLARSLDDAIKVSSRTRDALRSLSLADKYDATPIAQDLRKVAALLHAGFPTRVFYLRVKGFDTHAGQVGRRYHLLRGVARALECFYGHLKEIHREADVSIMLFSEFGRRVAENSSGGTDHGTAGPIFLVGPHVVSGFHQTHPSLTDLDDNGDLKMTVDFRDVYASVILEWFGIPDPRLILESDVNPLGLFRQP